MKRYLFVLRQPPHQNSRVQEVLDQMLTTGAFDQHVGLLFLDDGVLQVAGAQETDHWAFKDTLSIFKALSVYGVEQVFVECESLADRGLFIEDLAMPVESVLRCQVGDLMRRFDVIIPD